MDTAVATTMLTVLLYATGTASITTSAALTNATASKTVQISG